MRFDGSSYNFAHRHRSGNVLTSRLARIAISAMVAAAFLIGVPAATAQEFSRSLADKADPWVVRALESDGSEEFLVVLGEQADVSAAADLGSKEEKGRFVFETLRAAAEQSQRSLRAWLVARGIEHRPFWIVNMVLVRGDASIARELAARSEVSRIAANPKVRRPDTELKPWAQTDTAVESKALAATEWGVAKIGAPDVWLAGFQGQNVVVAGADTGVDWSHSALRPQYRGWNGAVANHNYQWHDAIHTGGGSCGANTVAPCDDDGHGTHTMGTMVGDDGGANKIGVAPGARWIGCRNMDQGAGTPATYAECFQWFMAPTNLAGAFPDPSKAPHVINNSWSCPPSEGCTDPNVLRAVVENVRAAGIVVVVSAGNSGPACATIDDPTAIYDAALTVGATDINDDLANFSSRGPVTVDGSNRLKPDVSAPGVNVRSSLPGNTYGAYSGTSMASPHVAGAVALLLSAYPSLAAQRSAAKSAITRAAVPQTSAVTCGGVPGSSTPNNSYGWGRLDVKAAYDAGPVATLDIDASVSKTKYDALTDGLLALRYLSGLTGAELTTGALGDQPGRSNPVAIKAYLDAMGSALDIDGNGIRDGATDGLLLLRYLMGLRGEQLTAGALGMAPGRAAPPAIQAYIESLIP